MFVLLNNFETREYDIGEVHSILVSRGPLSDMIILLLNNGQEMKYRIGNRNFTSRYSRIFNEVYSGNVLVIDKSKRSL